MTEKIEEIKEAVIQCLIRIARKGEKEKGAIVVLGGKPKYKSMKKNKSVSTFNVLEDIDLFEFYAEKDGAMIVDENGLVLDYQVMLESDKVMEGKGTRHAAALSASFHEGVIYSILASGNERKVKIFKHGTEIVIDTLEPGIDKNIKEVVSVVDSLSYGALTYFGTSILAPTVAAGLGLAVLPGVIVFGSAYYLISLIRKKENVK